MPVPSDPHGQAALLLCESLLLLLVHEGIIEKSRVVDAIEAVSEVERERAEHGTSREAYLTTLGILRAAGASVAAIRPRRNVRRR